MCVAARHEVIQDLRVSGILEHAGSWNFSFATGCAYKVQPCQTIMHWRSCTHF